MRQMTILLLMLIASYGLFAQLEPQLVTDLAELEITYVSEEGCKWVGTNCRRSGNFCDKCAIVTQQKNIMNCACDPIFVTSVRDIEMGNNKLNLLDITDFNVFPNPNKGNFTVNFYIHDEGMLQARLYNLDGALFYEFDEYVSKGSYEKTINLKDKLSKGVYYLELRIGEQQVTKKIITR